MRPPPPPSRRSSRHWGAQATGRQRLTRCVLPVCPVLIISVSVLPCFGCVMTSVLLCAPILVGFGAGQLVLSGSGTALVPGMSASAATSFAFIFLDFFRH